LYLFEYVALPNASTQASINFLECKPHPALGQLPRPVSWLVQRGTIEVHAGSRYRKAFSDDKE
jgi:hypothetical protein